MLETGKPNLHQIRLHTVSAIQHFDWLTQKLAKTPCFVLLVKLPAFSSSLTETCLTPVPMRPILAQESLSSSLKEGLPLFCTEIHYQLYVRTDPEIHGCNVPVPITYGRVDYI